MLLSIIMVSYNTQVLTRRAIESALRDIDRSDVLKNQSEIIVVDNNSADESASMLRRLKKQSATPITLLFNDTNPGYAAANNQAIKKSNGEYILLLNPDTYVQAGCLEKLVVTLEGLPAEETTAYSPLRSDPYDRVGLLAATLLNPDGTLQAQGGDLPTLWSVANQFFLLDDIPILGQFLPSTQDGTRRQPPVNYTDADELDVIPKGWVGGTAMLIRRTVLDEIGFLDENIFMYGEDVEFCLRATAHHWDVAQHPTARVTHVQSASAGTTNALVGEVKGLLYLFSKHRPAWQKTALTTILRCGALLRMVLFTALNFPRTRIHPYEQIWQSAASW